MRLRSITVMAVLLTLVGGYIFLSSLWGMGGIPAMWATVEEGYARLDEQQQATQKLLREMAEQGQITAEELAKHQASEARLSHYLHEQERIMRELFALPTAQAQLVLILLSGLASLVAGIFLLLGKNWAPTLARWQAVYSLPVMLLVAVWSQLLIKRLLTLNSTFEGEVNRGTVPVVPTAAFWRWVLLILAWNGFVLWFFSRPSAKARSITGSNPSRSRYT